MLHHGAGRVAAFGSAQRAALLTALVKGAKELGVGIAVGDGLEVKATVNSTLNVCVPCVTVNSTLKARARGNRMQQHVCDRQQCHSKCVTPDAHTVCVRPAYGCTWLMM